MPVQESILDNAEELALAEAIAEEVRRHGGVIRRGANEDYRFPLSSCAFGEWIPPSALSVHANSLRWRDAGTGAPASAKFTWPAGYSFTRL